jgi:hypothetical protein
MSETIHNHSDYPQFFKKIIEFVENKDEIYYLNDLLQKPTN